MQWHVRRAGIPANNGIDQFALYMARNMPKNLDQKCRTSAWWKQAILAQLREKIMQIMLPPDTRHHAKKKIRTFLYNG